MTDPETNKRFEVVFSTIEQRRKEATDMAQGVKRHVMNEVNTIARDIREDLSETNTELRRVNLVVFGDGNGHLGLIRRHDAHEREREKNTDRIAMLETTVQGIPEQLQGIRDAVASSKSSPPPSMRSGKTKWGLSPDTQHTVIVSLVTAAMSVLGVGGYQTVMAPEQRAVDTQAEALAQKQAELERAKSELEKERREWAKRRQWDRDIDRWRPHPMNPSPEATVEKSE